MTYRGWHTIPIVIPDPEPLRQLAAAVIAQALDDAVSNHVASEIRDQARWFLETDWLAFWCEVAGLDVALVRARIVDALPKRAGRPRQGRPRGYPGF